MSEATNLVTLDSIDKIAARGSHMTAYDISDGQWQAINERIVPENIQEGIKRYGGMDFFVQVETGYDPVLRKGLPVPKVAAEPRLSMPLPNYEQQVYHYKSGDVTLLWAIPDMNYCALLRVEALNLHPEEKLNLMWVNNFYDGTYARMSNEYNKNLKV